MIATYDDLPNELLFLILQHLPLVPLILSRSLNIRWNQLTNAARLPFGRRPLLDLYLDAVNSPGFLQTRNDILPYLAPFDREMYLEGIENPYTESLPVEFRTWILEWPEKAIIGRVWPSWSELPRKRHSEETAFKRLGKNYLHKVNYTLIFKTIPLLKSGNTHKLSVYEDDVDPRKDCPDRAYGLIVHNYKNDEDDGPVADVLVFGGHGTGAEFSNQVITVDVGLGLCNGPTWVEFLRAELRRSEMFLERKKQGTEHEVGK